MQRKFEQERDEYLRALATSNWNDVVLHATELLKIDDNWAEVWANRGVGLFRLGFPLDSILNFDRSLALNETAAVCCNKGSALQEIGKYDEAMKWFEKTIEIEPSLPEAHMNKGHLHKWQGDDDIAIECYRNAVAAKPDHADANMALGMLLLKKGQLKEGWEKYEFRWSSDQLVLRGLKYPQWKGEDLNGKKILVYGEQGLGDMIQFVRYVRVLKQKYPDVTIIVEGRQPVKRLFLTINEIASVINLGNSVPEVDYVIPMITLAGFFTPTMDDIPIRSTQFDLRKVDVADWRRRMEELPKGFRVGLCWAGMARTAHPMAMKIDGMRSMHLSQFAPLAKIKNIIWVSLQKGSPSEQIAEPPVGMTIADYTEDMYDFYETCCVIENCDLVITVDTAVAHAAASIGKPTWILSRWDGCWRWHGKRADSPWYPSVHQFVQHSPSDWGGVIAEMGMQLDYLVKNKTELELNLTMAK